MDPANLASVSAKTSTPSAIASGEANSSGRWLHPLRHGMKIMPEGAIWAMNRASWYGWLTSSVEDKPSCFTDALTTCIQHKSIRACPGYHENTFTPLSSQVLLQKLQLALAVNTLGVAIMESNRRPACKENEEVEQQPVQLESQEGHF